MLVLLFVAIVGVCLGTSVSRHDRKPPAFTVNLDLPPAHRWDHVIPQFAGLAKEVHKLAKYLIGDYFVRLVEDIATAIDSYLPFEYAEEMRGIARALNTSLGDIVLINIFYDMTATLYKESTAIICLDNEGHIWHVRNMDCFYAYLLINSTIKVDFQKGGQTEYTGVTFAGYVGLTTAQRPNAFTITMGERDKGKWWMNLLIAILDQTAKPLGFLIRDVLTSSRSFAEAVDVLSSTDTEADCYFIVGGVRRGEGVVITKSRIGSDDLWYMNEAAPGWFLVQTNYDHWEQPPQADNRRQPAINAMNSTGQSNISVSSLYNIISMPTLNNIPYVYSVVMSAGQPSIFTSWASYPLNIYF